MIEEHLFISYQFTAELDLHPRAPLRGKAYTRVLRHHKEDMLAVLEYCPLYRVYAEKAKARTQWNANSLANLYDLVSGQAHVNEVATLLRTLQPELYGDQVPEANWIIARVPRLIYNFWFRELRSLIGKHIDKPLFGPHITIARNEGVLDLSKVARGQSLSVTIGPSIHLRSGLAWTPAESTEIEVLRESLGLPEKKQPPLHMTIGRFNEGN